MLRCLLVGFVLALSACGSGPVDNPFDAGHDAAAPVADAGEGQADAAPTPVDAAQAADDAASADATQPDAAAIPRIVFTQGEGAARQEVSSVVYAQAYDVRVEGLVPGETITLGAGLWGYRSQADFVAGADGAVDVGRDAPISGSYQGVDADGLVWSMNQLNTDTGTDYSVTYVASRGTTTIAQARLDRTALGGDAVWTDVRDNGLWGKLLVPPGAGPHPALLVLGGSEGGTPEFEAAYYESMGYETLALAYFAEPGLPAGLTDIPLEYFDKALDWMRARPEIDAQRIGVVGGSRGGELALILAWHCPDLRAVVASVPSGLFMGSASVVGKAAWTLGGVEIPYFDVPTDVQPVEETLPNGKTAERDAPVLDAELDAATPQQIEAARIHVEDSTGPILLLAAGDDGLWPSCRLSDIAWSALVSQGHAARLADDHVCFPNAGHLIGAPGWPTGNSYAIEMPNFPGLWLVVGGTQEGYGHADRQLDTRVRAFLKAALSP
jgi:acetyl esterase/lipase